LEHQIHGAPQVAGWMGLEEVGGDWEIEEREGGNSRARMGRGWGQRRRRSRAHPTSASYHHHHHFRPVVQETEVPLTLGSAGLPSLPSIDGDHNVSFSSVFGTRALAERTLTVS
jgi:hypothetical protein